MILMLKSLKILSVAVFFLLIFLISSWGHIKNFSGSQVFTTAPRDLPASAEQSFGDNQISTKPFGVAVVRVVDGDTIVVSTNVADEKVRLIGVNTPETVDPRKKVECFGKEASNFTKSILSGNRVSLEMDPTQGDRDKYGRLLRYVILENGANFNKRLIEEGYAYEYTYRYPYKYQKGFKQAQKDAEFNKRGLWAASACGETSNI